MTDCPFCALQEVESLVLASNEHAFALLDVAPIRPGHVLVMPRRHTEDFFDLDASVQACMLSLANQLAKSLKAVCNPQRVGLLLAGFDVPHAHLHVVPMHDCFDITSRVVMEGGKVMVPEEELQEMRVRLRRDIAAP